MTIESWNINRNSHRLNWIKVFRKEHVTIENSNIEQNPHRLTSESNKDSEKRTRDH